MFRGSSLALGAVGKGPNVNREEKLRPSITDLVLAKFGWIITKIGCGSVLDMCGRWLGVRTLL